MHRSQSVVDREAAVTQSALLLFIGMFSRKIPGQSDGSKVNSPLRLSRNCVRCDSSIGLIGVTQHFEYAVLVVPRT